ncbi:MAG: thiamine phosphate synthase [Caulobacteraceae bacterium]
MRRDLPQTAALLAIARRLNAEAQVRLGAKAAGLPVLWLFTDPLRVPDPVAAAEAMPAGSGVIYRPFAASDRKAVARALAGVARRLGLTLLIGGAPALARTCGAAGVHLPERFAHRAPAVRSAWPEGIVTAAAHSAAAIARAERSGAHAAFVSPVFESPSPSAGKPLGVRRFRRLVQAAGLPVYALGGVDMKTAPELLGSGAAGIAAIGALVRT